MKYKVEIVDTCNGMRFKEKCEALLNAGYEMKSCSCGIVQSEEYDFCSSYMAVFIKTIED